MMKLATRGLVLALGLVMLGGCSDMLKKTIEENPDIILNAIEKHPEKFLMTLNKAVEETRRMAAKKAQMSEEEALEEEFKNPKNPKIDENRVFFGPKKAPITIVEYSDFQCPYCTKGFDTMNEVKKKYGDKVRILYKHLPLDFHPQALPAALYFEAIAQQDHVKAEKFHDKLFMNQADLKLKKEAFLDELTKSVGANLGKVKKAIESEKVKEIVEADIAEAREFGFSGTPGFLVNGVSVKGAYPADHFVKIIDRHLAKK